MERISDTYDYERMYTALKELNPASRESKDLVISNLKKLKARFVHLKDRNVLVRQGEPARIFAVILSGSLHMTIRAANGEARLISLSNQANLPDILSFSCRIRAFLAT